MREISGPQTVSIFRLPSLSNLLPLLILTGVSQAGRERSTEGRKEQGEEGRGTLKKIWVLPLFLPPSPLHIPQVPQDRESALCLAQLHPPLTLPPLFLFCSPFTQPFLRHQSQSTFLTYQNPAPVAPSPWVMLRIHYWGFFVLFCFQK